MDGEPATEILDATHRARRERALSSPTVQDVVADLASPAGCHPRERDAHSEIFLADDGDARPASRTAKPEADVRPPDGDPLGVAG